LRSLRTDLAVELPALRLQALEAAESRVEPLAALVRLARSRKDHRLAGLARRELSRAMAAQGRRHSALLEAERSVLELSHLDLSADLHLSSLQAADCALEIGHRTRAAFHVESVHAPVDEHVAFPLDYMSARLGRRPMAALDPDAYSIVLPHWLHRWKSNRTTMPPAVPFVTPPGAKLTTVEKKVLESVCREPRSRDFLRQLLRAEHAEEATLEIRLRKTLARLNRKIAGGLVFDGQRYKLV
jgi:hypothetical protein